MIIVSKAYEFAKAHRYTLTAAALVLTPSIYYFAFSKDKDGNPRQAKRWQVAAYELIPLRAASRVWGFANNIPLPVWLRPYSFGLYSWMFHVKMFEAADEDFRHYANLGEFFYRDLKPGVRPISKSLVVSPADGRVLQFGQLQDRRDKVDKVKGQAYSLDQLVGAPRTPPPVPHKVHQEAPHLPGSRPGTPEPEAEGNDDEAVNLSRHGHFAEMNGVPYTLDEMMGNSDGIHHGNHHHVGDAVDEAREDPHDAAKFLFEPTGKNRLFYCVVYLDPGDYHHFHSPVPWVCATRRHFVGDLLSVAPYFQSRLANLFTLNERVALLGHWKHGFFSMTPVGATNVGSIIVNFDRFLKTNVRGELKHHVYEASYEAASEKLKGYPLHKGEEMGGFKLGSTVVLVFEAPNTFQFEVSQGQRIKVGETIGDLTPESEIPALAAKQ